MSFLYPTFLFALFALAIPIIIHLFNFRKYKKVYFTNLQFLKNIQQESENKSKIKHWLILASRLLALTCLILAFAQPFIPKANNNSAPQGKKAISIFIDNSFSMEMVNKNGYLLENAKKKAKEILNAYSNSDRFQLLTNNFEGKHQRLISKDDFLAQLDQVKISPINRSFDEISNRQKEALDNESSLSKKSYIISDFQKTQYSFNKQSLDTTNSITLIPLEANEIGNVYIDSVWFESPVQQANIIQKLHLIVQNQSEKSIENASIKLYINDKAISPASYTVDANAKKEVVISFLIKEKGIQNAYVQLDDYPVTFDDKFYFSFYVEKNIPVLVIHGKNEAETASFDALLKNDSMFLFNTNTEAAIDFGLFEKNNLIVLNQLSNISSGLSQQLKKYIEQGGDVALFPAKDADLISYNTFLSTLNCNNFVSLDTSNTKVDYINANNVFFEGVFEKKTDNMDVPKIYNYFTQSKKTQSNEEVIMRLLNGSSFLSLYNYKKGKIYVCNTPLNTENTNFSKHALFVPTLIKMAINSKNASLLYLTCGKNQSYELDKAPINKEKPYHITNDKLKLNLIPEARINENGVSLFMQNAITDAGNYMIDEDNQHLYGISFNFNRNESKLSCYDNEELIVKVKELSSTKINIINGSEASLTSLVSEINESTKLWKWFVIFTLLFLAIEIALIKFLK